MSVGEVFARCSIKINELETLLLHQLGAGKSPQVTRDNPRVNIGGRQNRPVIAINYQGYRGTAAHAIYIIRNAYLPNNWAIFNSNGSEGTRGILAGGGEGGVLIIQDNRAFLAADTILDNHMQISPTESINTGSDSENPGFCNIFGLIFLCYYLKNKDNSNWVDNWQIILLNMESDETRRLRLAQNVLTKISRSREDWSTLIEEIYVYLLEWNSISGRGDKQTSSKRYRGPGKSKSRGKYRSKYRCSGKNRRKCRSSIKSKNRDKRRKSRLRRKK